MDIRSLSFVKFESSVAPGVKSKGVLESCQTVSDYDMAMAKSETVGALNKPTPGLGGKHGLYSTNGVHELLECPVCTSLMYPPIHQVHLQFRLSVFHPDSLINHLRSYYSSSNLAGYTVYHNSRSFIDTLAIINGSFLVTGTSAVNPL